MSVRFLCVGRVYADLVFQSRDLPSWGREVFTRGVEAVAGGGAFITAAYLRHLGHPVQLAGLAGGDGPFDAIVRSGIARCDLDARHLTFGAGAQVTVAIAGQEDRAFLTRRVPGPVPLPQATVFDHLHIGELATLIECPDLIGLARRAGASISVDCGDQQGDWPASVPKLLAQVDVFMPNESELSALQGAGLSADEAPLLVVKQGGQGARARTDGKWIAVPAKPAEVVDTTGAGDAFAAGFLGAWRAGATVKAALGQGVQMGALAVSRLGGLPPRTDPAAEQASAGRADAVL